MSERPASPSSDPNASNHGGKFVPPVSAPTDETAEDVLREWQRISPPHRYECNPWSELGCTCGLNELRRKTQAVLARREARDDG